MSECVIRLDNKGYSIVDFGFIWLSNNLLDILKKENLCTNNEWTEKNMLFFVQKNQSSFCLIKFQNKNIDRWNQFNVDTRNLI